MNTHWNRLRTTVVATGALAAHPVQAEPPAAAVDSEDTTFVTVDGSAPDDPRGFNLATGAEAHFGQSSAFDNQMAGARVTYRFDRHVSFGGYVGVVSLKGRDGRAYNVLPYSSLEYRLLFGRGWGLPIRAGAGYLPKNGPFARLGPGLAIPLGESTEIIADPFVPTFWLTQNRPELAFGFGAELVLRL